ncbi:hypothetical protein [Enterococcus italicus]|uniref:hypothetical protein n=1 Tax=Enterococcus italicus TaxID=246144 RepID=UPI0028AC140D|nr:hypothetical protein [Enterococcus italicus]
MYYRNQIGSVTKTKNGVIFEDLYQISNIEIKPCDERQERIDSMFMEYVAILKAGVLVQELRQKKTPPQTEMGFCCYPTIFLTTSNGVCPFFQV